MNASVYLIGAGIVGRAIADSHLAAGMNVALVDGRAEALTDAVIWLRSRHVDFGENSVDCPINGRSMVTLGRAPLQPPGLLIESISENLAAKQSLFREARATLGPDIILASNTSNLRIADVFASMGQDTRCCGMHFFMPVGERPLVELIASPATTPQTSMACQQHASLLGKASLEVKDSPGFVVNRLLAPYLNQALLLLGQGASSEMLGDAASAFGMPMSPLRLIDTIGVRTAFDSGRVFWQSFPERIDPAPILPGMIKAGRLGTMHGGGFYDSSAATKLCDKATAVVAKYQRDAHTWTLDEVTQWLSIPMWIEAAEALATGIVSQWSDIELAMRGGLGYAGESGFAGFFDNLGSSKLIDTIRSGGAVNRSLAAPVALIEELSNPIGGLPSGAVLRYASQRGPG